MKKHLAAIGIALSSVVGGVAVGATLLAPTVASAQTADATPDEGTTCARPEHHRGAGLEAAAEAIGISVDDLRAELHDGKSIADVAAANGVDVQTVIDAMVADVQAHLSDAVADGKITQAQADERLADATERITDHVSNPPPPGAEGEGRPPRGPRPPDAA